MLKKMKYFKKKKKPQKISTLSVNSIPDFSLPTKSKTLSHLTPPKEKSPFDRAIDLIFQSGDPCSIDLGIDPSEFSVEYLPPTPVREITLTRTEENGDHGFSLRKKIIPEIFNSDKRQAIFIASQRHATVIGARLLSVNGISVEDLSVEEVTRKIVSSGHRVVCQIQQIREFTEIYKFLLNYDQQNLWFSEKPKNSTLNLSIQHFWLLHRLGFTPCFTDGTDEGGQEVVHIPDMGLPGLTVPADALERINPPDLDFIEDCSNLWHLNESGVIHTLRCRFLSSLFSTFAGRNLIFLTSHVKSHSFCPGMSELFYSSPTSESFPPHVFSLCQRMYLSVGGKSDESLIFMGHNDSGQDQLFQNSVTHFLRSPHGGKSHFTYSKWKAVLAILEAITSHDDCGLFGGSVMLVSLFYDSLGDLSSGSIRLCLVNVLRILSARNNLFCCLEETNASSTAKWNTLIESFGAIGVEGTELDSVISVLKGIHSLTLIFQSDDIFEQDSFVFAAKCLSMTPKELKSMINCEQRSSKLIQMSEKDLVLSFSAALFQNVLDCVLLFINRSMNPERLSNSPRINLLYHPGVSILDKSRWIHSLFLGYFHEKVNLLLYKFVFKTPLDVFKKENIDIDGFFVNSSAEETVEEFEGKGENSWGVGLLRTLDNALRKGLNSAELVECFMESDFDRERKLLRKLADPQSFIFMHSNSMQPVQYDCSHWMVEMARMSRYLRMKNRLINSKIGLFSDNLPRNTSHFVTFPGHKIELVANDIVDALEGSKLSFVYCISPSLDSEGCLSSPSLLTSTGSSLSPSLNDVFDVPFVRIQLRAMMVVPSTRIFRYGYPDHISVAEFKSSYSLLGTSEKDMIDEIMQKGHIEHHDYALGVEEVFMKDGVIPRLNEVRDCLISDYMVSFQTKVRAHLSLKSHRRLISIMSAVKTIQHNMRVYLSLKKWRWWNLFVGLTPIASVSWVDSHMKTLKDQLSQKCADHEHELAERDKLIDKLRNEVVEITKEMMEDKINLTEAGEVIENSIEENRLLAERILRLEKSGDFELKDQRVKIDGLMSRISELEGQVEQKNHEISYWKRQTSHQSLQKLDLKRQASIKSNRPTEFLRNEERDGRNVSENSGKMESMAPENDELRRKKSQMERQQRDDREKILELQDEVEELTERLGQSQQQCLALETSAGQLRMREEEARDEGEDRLRALRRDLAGKCEHLEDMLTCEKKKSFRLEEVNQKLSHELARSKLSSESYMSDTDKLRSKVAKLKAMLKDAQYVEKPARGQEEVCRLQQEIDESEAALRTALREKRELESELEDSRVMVENYRRARDEMEGRVRKVTSSLTESEVVGEERLIELENAQRSLKALTWEVSMLKETVGQRETEISSLKKEIGRMKEKIFQMEDQLSLKSQAQVTPEMDGLRMKLDLAEGQNSRLQSQFKSAREELASKKAEIDDLVIKNLRVEEQLRSLSSRNRTLEKERETLREEKQEMISRMGRLLRDCGVAESALEEAREENLVIRGRLLSLRKNINAEIEDSDSNEEVGDSDSNEEAENGDCEE